MGLVVAPAGSMGTRLPRRESPADAVNDANAVNAANALNAANVPPSSGQALACVVDLQRKMFSYLCPSASVLKPIDERAR